MTSNDFSNCPTKHATRVATLDTVIATYLDGTPVAPRLFDGTHLRVDWMELAGKPCPTFPLVKPYLQRPQQFIGVDIDPEALQENERLYGTDQARWVHGRLEDLLTPGDPRNEKVGVLVFDGFDGVQRNSRKLPKILDLCRTFAEYQQHQLGEFLLVLNMSLCRSVPLDVSYYQNLVKDLFGRAHFHQYRSEGKKTDMLLSRFAFGF